MEGSVGKTTRLVVFSQKPLYSPHFKGLLENEIERRFLHAFGRAGLGGAAWGGCSSLQSLSVFVLLRVYVNGVG